jgi:hypothetical protein
MPPMIVPGPGLRRSRSRPAALPSRPTLLFLCLSLSAIGATAAQPPLRPSEVAPPAADVVGRRYGLRAARRIDPRTIRLSFGPSFVPAIGAQAATYRIVSPDDPAFQPGIRPVAARDRTAPDDTPPAGWMGKRYQRHAVELALPRPMQDGRRYWVQVLGVKGQPATGGRAALWIQEMDDATEQCAASESSLGVRALELLAPVVVQLTVGDSFDAARFDGHPETIVLRSDDDADYRGGRKATRVGRRSRGDCFYPDGWPYGYFLEHELFAVFDVPLKQGKTYTLDLNAAAPLTGGAPRASLRVVDRTTINPAIKVNQVGYLPGAAAKYAYLGAWMGSLGALDYGPWARAFEVRDAASDQPVLEGSCRLRHRAGEKTETVYHADLSMEDVYQMDLSGLTREGSYYLAVPGMGRSLPFRVARDAYVEPFRVMMNGVLHQRCGIEMKLPSSPHFRPACHRNRTELTDLVQGSSPDPSRDLPKHVTGDQKRDLYGGHHDAGDYNPRSHLDVAEVSFMAYEIRPRVFYDGQLRIPEAGNGIPDILDEGRWALDLWTRLQDEDGGVRNGTESDGDPDMITPAADDPKRDFAFAKDAAGSLRFAACAAQASLIWGGLKRDPDARSMLQRAVRAWDWAARHGAEQKPDALALAAIQLYRATGESKYVEAFRKHSVFTRRPDAELEEYQRYDQRDASFYYAFCARPVDPLLKERVVAAFRRKLDLWVRWAETTAYRYMRSPYAPNTWGTGAHPKWVLDAIQGYVLLKDPRYLEWIHLTCDFALGCHPMNRVFTAGLGQRSIAAPLHMDSRYTPDGPIAGIQCQGPSPRVGGSPAGRSMGSWIDAMLFPRGAWPELQTYTDVGMCPEMNEGLVSDQIRTAAAYAFLLPERMP